jgi:membrane-bound inhibitor of C-type lysozyme
MQHLSLNQSSLNQSSLNQKRFHTFVKAAYLLLAGAMLCVVAQSLLAQEPASQPQATASQPAASGAPAAQTAWHRVSYACDNNTHVRVSYRGTIANVIFKGQLHPMKQVPSADGARYSDGKLVWWSKGNGGFLTEDTDGGPSGPPRLADNCTQIAPKVDSPAAAPK